MTSRSSTSSTATPDNTAATRARRRAPHNPNVYVVQVAPSGEWVADCCDPRCGWGSHNLLSTMEKARAEAAATRHRHLLGTLPVPPDNRPRQRKRRHCDSCGQARHAIEELQDLVAELEAGLAKHESSWPAVPRRP